MACVETWAKAYIMHLSSEVQTFLFVFVSLTHIFAICLTFLRLYHRYRISRLWFDDLVAAIACILDGVAILDLWLGNVKSNPQHLVVKYKIGFLGLISAEWATRIALALAFARVLQRTRHYAISLAIMFLCIFIAVLIQALSCNNDFAWTTTSFSQCDSHGELIIFLVIANLFADFLLVFSPLYALRRLRLPTHERRLIFACFAGSAFMSLACITTTVFQFLPAPQWAELRIITAYLEGSVSLIVCNLLVIVTYFYKVFRPQRDIEEVPTTQILPPEMHEAEGTSVQPTLTPVATEENVTSIDLTEISGAYFTDSISPSSVDGESYKTNSEANVTDH